MNNPLNLFDPDGKAPGDLFKSKREAAKDWGKIYNGRSIIIDKEFGSSIYVVSKGGNTFFSYTEPSVGKAYSVTPSEAPTGTKKVADIHSHGAKSQGYLDNQFSGTDTKGNDKDGTIGFVTTPNGSLLEYDNNTKKVSTVSTQIPSDPNDPSRKNNIDPNPIKFEVNMDPNYNTKK